MRAETLPANAGWRWMSDGFAIFRKNPALFSMLVVLYWTILIFVNIVPGVGAVISSLLIPGLSVGLMQVARDLERGHPVALPTLFNGFQRNPRTLLVLGALYLCATLAVLALSTLIDGGDFLKALISSDELDREALESGAYLLPAAFVTIALLPVLMAWWFAPVLAAWHNLGVGRALFFSFVACWLNWRAFFSFSLALLLFAGILPGMVFGLLLAVIPSSAAAFVATPLLLLIAVTVFSTVYASFYASYRDIFGNAELV